MTFDRTNRNIFSSWWWTVDRLTLSALAIIVLFGLVMVSAASPAVAERIGLESFFFIKRQAVFLSVSLLLMLSISILSPTAIRRLAFLGFSIGILLMIAVLIGGAEAKGAKRWIYIGSFSLQPSEFVKPCFAVLTAWILAQGKINTSFPAYRLSIAIFAVIALLLVLQPDFGMTLTVSAVWAGQLFLSGIAMSWVIIAAITAISGIIAAYIFLPHVAARINSFLDPASGDTYQVRKSLEAFHNGGLMGQGPGEGQVKLYLPDSHTDFIFAVAGEELGMIAGLIIIGLFCFVVLRGFGRIVRESDQFIVFAVSGLLMQFGIQAIINMGVSLNLFPTKGMTLPFISYGGSSMLAVALGMGMMLALTRKRYGVVMHKEWVMP